MYTFIPVIFTPLQIHDFLLNYRLHPDDVIVGLMVVTINDAPISSTKNTCFRSSCSDCDTKITEIQAFPFLNPIYFIKVSSNRSGSNETRLGVKEPEKVMTKNEIFTMPTMEQKHTG